jgi:hypothetical protein
MAVSEYTRRRSPVVRGYVATELVVSGVRCWTLRIAVVAGLVRQDVTEHLCAPATAAVVAGRQR